MAIPQELEELSSQDSDGCIAHGIHREVISGLAGGLVARQLLASESGALCLFDDAAGQIYTLPPPAVGLEFKFLVTVTQTSNSHTVITDAATTFMGGGIVMMDDGGSTHDAFASNIATGVQIQLDGATAGEQAGGAFTMTCISATEWVCEGYAIGVGTMVTPFA